MDKRERYRALLSAQADALGARILLDELRAGRTKNVLELLERRLDTSICIIKKLSLEVDSGQRASIIDSLRILKKYRLRNPRKTEAVFDEVDDALERQEAQKRARKILDEIPDA